MLFSKIVRYTLSALAVVGLLVPFAIAQDVSNPNTLVVARISQPESLDPAWNFDTASNEVLKHMYLTLFEFEGSAVNNFVPAVAAEVPTVDNGGISADGLTYRIPIREGLQFASGEPITPEDVEYSLERTMVIDRDGGPAFLLNDVLVFGSSFSSTRDGDGNLLQEVDGVSLAQAIDEAIQVEGNEVVFDLKIPFPPFLQVLTGGVGVSILNKSFVVEQGGWPGFTGDREADMATIAEFNNPEVDATTLFETCGCSGSFSLVNWDRTTGEVLLERNPNFLVPSQAWGEIFGTQSLGSILFREVFENSTRELGLQQGEIDVADIQPASRLDEIKDTPGVRVIDQIPGLSYDSIHFNYDFRDAIEAGTAVGVGSGQLDGSGVPGDFFQDVDVRAGFAHAFNQEVVIEDVLNGRSTRPATPVHAGLPFHDPDVEGVPFDLAAAEERLRAARDGEVWANGFEVDCIYNEGNTRRQVACEVLAANLAELNPDFRVNVTATPFSVFLGQIIDGIMPLYSLGWAPDFVDAGNFMDQWMTSAGFYSGFNDIDAIPAWGAGGSVELPSGDTFEYANWDELLKRAFEEPEVADRQALYTEAQQEFVDHFVSVSLSNPTDFEVTRDWVGGLVYNGSLATSLHHGTFKAPGALPNCVEIERVGAVTLDGSC